MERCCGRLCWGVVAGTGGGWLGENGGVAEDGIRRHQTSRALGRKQAEESAPAASQLLSCCLEHVHVRPFIRALLLCLQELLRHYGGIGKFVHLLDYGAEAECTHRALLALRILTDKEVDRLTIMKTGGVRPLVRLLDSGPESEITEYAAAALGNLAAGSQPIKDALREAGAIPPLVKLLRDDPEQISAELAAVVLRNLSLQNPANRQEIVEAGGLEPLLRLLSSGQEKLHFPLSCVAEYLEIKSATQMKTKSSDGQCCFDPAHGHLCLAVVDPSKLGCFGPSATCNPRDRNAERYSLLRKLTITEPDNHTLELNFTAPDKQGPAPIAHPNRSNKSSSKRLQRIILSSCNATEVKGAIMRMLTRMHLEREFRMNHAANVPVTGRSPQSESPVEPIPSGSMVQPEPRRPMPTRI
ncbi:unnamed protein product [Ostreobium quekettii]|uniref:Uncharacterized protein n=1 Tax=Ostreobium quekettii TaxID=121088 RepID=A0A8S1IRB6_9CHLO|nr:unnamed protein product [Ostreobium quekettii]